MADGLLKWCVTKVHGLFSDVNKLKDNAQKTDAHVSKLASRVNDLSKVQDIQGREAEALKARVSDLESQNHGLKISRGKIKAKLDRAGA